MNFEFAKIERDQLEKKLKVWQPLRKQSVPKHGWMRAIRTNLGLTRDALAKRLKISPASVADLERSEESGAITLNSLRKVAMAMDCEVVYAVVPRKTLTAILEEKAVEKANAMLSRVDHSMRLEAQEIESSKGLKQRRAVVQSLLNNPKALWK